ncbi:MAG: hypothetical protein ACKVPX_08365 [Myxococcaceae bacterium]
MRTLSLALAVSAVLAAAPANAQFANRSLGLSVGYSQLFIDNARWGIPFGLEGSAYIEGGFDATASLHMMVLEQPVCRDGSSCQVISLSPGIGFRYLFLEETIRPYVGAEFIYLHLFRDRSPTGTSVDGTVSDFIGIGPRVGVDFFVSDSISLGVRGHFNLYWMLNQPLQTAVGAMFKASTYF